VSPDGHKATFVSTEHMSVEHLASIIKGEPESVVALEVVHADTSHAPCRFVVSLKRAQTLTIQLPDGGGTALGYINPDNIPVPKPLGLTEPQMAVLKPRVVLGYKWHKDI
jgi:hypothetical protein